MNMGPQQKD